MPQDIGFLGISNHTWHGIEWFMQNFANPLATAVLVVMKSVQARHAGTWVKWSLGDDILAPRANRHVQATFKDVGVDGGTVLLEVEDIAGQTHFVSPQRLPRRA